MSIYVELLEKGDFFSKENKAELVKESRTTKGKEHFSVPGTVAQKNGADLSKKLDGQNKNAVNRLDAEKNKAVELPAIKNSWDSILSGTSSLATSAKEELTNDIPVPDVEENSIATGKEFSDLQDVREFTVEDKKPVQNLDKGAGIFSASRRSPDAKVKNQELKQSDSEKSIVPIPLRKLRLRGMVTPDMEHKGIIEEFRHLKRILTKNIAKSDRNMGVGIVVTSALPGEGKTFTSLNLILSLSMEKSKNILLVDADLEKGGSTRFMELERHAGLRDYLEDPSLNLEDVMVQTDLPNLRIIPRGIAETHSAEVFSSKRMEALIEKLCNSDVFDMVIFDAPPALVSSSANILSGLVDQTLVVVQANETSGNQIRELEDNLIDSRSMGYVLNRAPFSEKKHNIYYAQND